jgi:carbon monoxide dehydrogenase subunit G
VRVAAAPQRVWEVLADVENWPSWTPSVTSITRLDGGPLRIGSKVKIKQPRLPVTTWTVTELSSGESFTWIAAGPGYRTIASHRVQPADSGSVATLSLDQQGLVGELIGRLMAGLTNRYLAMEGNGLKERAERPAQR